MWPFLGVLCAPTKDGTRAFFGDSVKEGDFSKQVFNFRDTFCETTP
jgi:hypothetical protein